MNKKQLAQARNYFKYVLTGICKPIKLEALTPYEVQCWKEILDKRNELIEQFDIASRFRGLNVPLNKCWCGKEGKYDAEYELFGNNKKVCKRHIKSEI